MPAIEIQDEVDMQSPGNDRSGVRWLTPENTSVYEGTFSLLHCAIKGGTLYRGVHAVRMFPVRYPTRYVALRYFDEDAVDTEVGVIDNLLDFPEKQRRLIETSLSKYYYQQIITGVHHVECDFGLLFFDVETQRGREQFVIPWQTERVQDYGKNGKVLIESQGNHYIIPDTTALPPTDYRRFSSYIYW